MQTRGRRYTTSANGKELSPGLQAMAGIEVYVRSLLDEIKRDLEDIDKLPGEAQSTEKNRMVRLRLLSKKSAYKDVLQYIKESRGVI